MKKSCKRCVALENQKCRLGYPTETLYKAFSFIHPNPITIPLVECPKPLKYDDYHHGKRYKKP